MDFLRKLKESLMSTLPIIALVLVLDLVYQPQGLSLSHFLIGSVFLVLGLTLFSHGSDTSLVEVGQRLGAYLSHKHSITIMLIVGFVTGFFVTYSEPDVSVLAIQVTSVYSGLSKQLFIIVISFSVGLLTDLGLLFLLKGASLKILLTIGYILILLVCLLVDPAIAFDASGATTGPMTVPFIMALGIGLATTTKHKDDQSSTFGLVGVASVGPVISVLMLMLFASPSSSQAASSAHASRLGEVLVDCLGKVGAAFAPVVILSILFEIFFFKLGPAWIKRVSRGLIYSYLGIVLFIGGIEYGFLDAGRIIGETIKLSSAPWVAIPIGFFLGAVAVLAEPSVAVLVNQVEEQSSGSIKRSLVYSFLTIAVGIGVALAMARTLFNFDIRWALMPLVVIALILMKFCPDLFTGIAFDSGGVASGPMSTSFILSLAIGVSSDGGASAFGIVGFIAVMPLVTIQILGIIVKHKRSRS